MNYIPLLYIIYINYTQCLMSSSCSDSDALYCYVKKEPVLQGQPLLLGLWLGQSSSDEKNLKHQISLLEFLFCFSFYNKSINIHFRNRHQKLLISDLFDTSNISVQASVHICLVGVLSYISGPTLAILRVNESEKN